MEYLRGDLTFANYPNLDFQNTRAMPDGDMCWFDLISMVGVESTSTLVELVLP